MPEPVHFSAVFSADAVRDFEQVFAARFELARRSSTPAPHRASAARSRSPAPGVRAGHMPGAKNLHYAALCRPTAGSSRRRKFASFSRTAEVDLSSPVITTCGSGITAAVLLLALAPIGKDDVTLYDGSWTDWGRAPGRAGRDRAGVKCRREDRRPVDARDDRHLPRDDARGRRICRRCRPRRGWR